MSKIKDLPIYERPREKAKMYGIEALSNEELLAIIIGSGYKGASALDIAKSLLDRAQGLRNLFHLPYQFISEYKGLKSITSLKLIACFELNIRYLALPSYNDFKPILTTNDLYNRYFFKLLGLQQEILYMVVVDRNGKVKNESIIFKGSNDKLLVSFVEILRKIILENGRYFYLIHNHPNNTKYPSDVDILFTNQLNLECSKLNLKMLDHLIVFEGGYYSMNKQIVENI